MDVTWHTWEGQAPGPALVVLGAVHGNEPCGALALQQLQRELASGRWRMRSGRLSLVPVSNPLAWARRTRDGDRNLNRGFLPGRGEATHEDRFTNQLAPLLAQHDVLLDLHSFTAPGPPFAMIGPPCASPREPRVRAQEELALAQCLGVAHIVQGWLSVYDQLQQQRGQMPDALGKGTNEWMREQGGLAITLECGQHDEPAAPARAHAATLALMRVLGLLDDRPLPVQITTSHPVAPVRLSHVWLRHHSADSLVRDWPPFTPVCQGTPLLIRANGALVCAPCDGQVLFPNAAARVNEELLYFAT